jgi:predicted nucleotidyltransferase
MKPISPTPYPDVNEVLDLLFSTVQQSLGDQFTGMYLHGSLASGGFDEYSDIDVFVVTKSGISEETFTDLRAMHTEIAALDSPWAIQLEVAYVPEDALRRSDPSHTRYPHLDRGKGEVLHWVSSESDWNIYRYILRERGIVIWGPHPKTLIDPVSADDLRMAVAQGLPLWFNPILEEPAEINKRGLQSFFVLSICRMLYTLTYGEILPKAAAAAWGIESLAPRWTPLIERALIGRQNPDSDPDPEDVRGTLELMRYILQQNHPTPYVEVNDALNVLLVQAKEILGQQFVGMYLYGSLSSGGFDAQTSDIDFLVVTDGVLADDEVTELEAMHHRLWDSGLKWAARLEGSYVPKGLIRRHDPDGPPCPTVNEGKFYVDTRGSDWVIQRHVVREHGVVVDGPDPKTLIDSVSPDDIRSAVLGTLQEWWFPMLPDPAWLREHGPVYQAYAVITMCRALHALEHGTILSKPDAIQWAQAQYAPWKRLIETAVAASRQAGPEDFLEETLSLIRFVKIRATAMVEQDNPR